MPGGMQPPAPGIWHPRCAGHTRPMPTRSITEFGAVGDGATPCTTAIQAAIDAVGAVGGGTVHLPAGVWASGTIALRDHVALELGQGATLRALSDLAAFPRQAQSDGDRHARHLLVARGVRGAALRGAGTIDGNGPAFWQPSPGPRAWIPAKPDRVSPLLEFSGCSDLRVEDITIVDSPGWTLHLHCCDHVTVRDVRIANHLFGPNTDGIDINGCRDVRIAGCAIVAGDDGIVLKTTRDARSCERITISDCRFRTHCAAIKLGTESWHDFRDIAVTNCVVTRSPRAFAIYIFDGGTAERIAVSNLVCDTDSGFRVNRPIHLDLRRRDAGDAGVPAVRTGRIRDVSIEGAVIRTDGRILLTAADGGRLQDIALRGIRLRYPVVEDPEERCAGAIDLQFSKHSPGPRAARAAIVAENVDGLRVGDLSVAWPALPLTEAWGDEEPSPDPWRVTRDSAGTWAVPPMAVLWARDVVGLVDLAGCAPVGGAPLARVEGGALRLRE